MSAQELPVFLVGVETGCLSDQRRRIVVTDDVEGFGPGILATYPLVEIRANQPENAAFDYAQQHGLIPIRADVNLPEGYQEWWLSEDGPREYDDCLCYECSEQADLECQRCGVALCVSCLDSHVCEVVE